MFDCTVYGYWCHSFPAKGCDTKAHVSPRAYCYIEGVDRQVPKIISRGGLKIYFVFIRNSDMKSDLDI